jgi:hypothetical protein
MEADIMTEDRGEVVALMEPLSIGQDSRHRGLLTDLALDLAQKSAGFRRSLPPRAIFAYQSRPRNDLLLFQPH